MTRTRRARLLALVVLVLSLVACGTVERSQQMWDSFCYYNPGYPGCGE